VSHRHLRVQLGRPLERADGLAVVEAEDVGQALVEEALGFVIGCGNAVIVSDELLF
jgi:hypothetical protein